MRKVADVESLREPGKFYGVFLEGGKLKCFCPWNTLAPSWRRKAKECNHIGRVRAYVLFGKEFWLRNDLPPVTIFKEE